MDTNLIVAPHGETEIEDFAKSVGIPIERARYIESMRACFLSREHNYTRKTIDPIKKAVKLS